MAVVKLTRKQLIDAVRQLDGEDRMRLLSELIDPPTREEVEQTADRLRPEFRMPTDRQRRLSSLLQKGDAGTLSDEERRELESLCDEANVRTLEMAREIVRSVGNSGTVISSGT